LVTPYQRGESRTQFFVSRFTFHRFNEVEMPAQKATSALLKKLGPGFKNAFNKHKEDETDYGAAGNLPAGIEGGIARLSKIEVKEFQTGKLKGKPYMSFTGVVVSPQKFTDSDGNV